MQAKNRETAQGKGVLVFSWPVLDILAEDTKGKLNTYVFLESRHLGLCNGIRSFTVMEMKPRVVAGGNQPVSATCRWPANT